MRLIVNADDYALDKSTSQAILIAFQNGWVSSTSCMANMPDFDTCIQMAADANVLDYMGIHFNLTHGKPLTDSIRKNKFFCGANGLFHGNIPRLIPLDKRCRDDVQAEFQAQIDRLRSYGIPITHADSHHHIHTAPWIYFCVRQVLKDNGISIVRISNNCGKYSEMKRIYKRWFFQQLRRDGFCTTDVFGDYQALSSIKTMSAHTVELESHPVMAEGRVRNKTGSGYNDFQNGLLLYPYQLDEEKGF